MGARGPKSSAELEIPSVADLRGDARPEPPADLNAEQAAEWRAVVDRMPADWFQRETHGLLVQYCRHVITARRVAQMLADIWTVAAARNEGINVRDYDRLLKAQERESRCIASLATRMRLSQQSSYDKSRGKKQNVGPRPWETRDV